MENNKRIRINKRMMAWSDGQRTNVIPSEWHKVDDYGSARRTMLEDYREGDENYLTCTMIREACRCREYEADRCWERGQHLNALNMMLDAAMMVLPDEAEGFEFEDAQWLNPWESVCWHPNVKMFIGLVLRCRDYCRQDPRLWPVYDDSRAAKDYSKYIDDLRRWRHDS